MFPLDEIDRALLALVQANADLTLEQLGASVGLSAAAVQRRLSRHRKSGLITGAVTLLDSSAVGVPLLVLTIVTLERDKAPEIADFRRRVRKHPHVQQCYDLAGYFDIAMLISAVDMESYRGVTADLLDSNPNVKRYASHVVLSTLKRTLQIPLAP